MNLKQVRRIIRLQTRWVDLGRRIRKLTTERENLGKTLRELGIQRLSLDDLSRFRVKKQDEMQVIGAITELLESKYRTTGGSPSTIAAETRSAEKVSPPISPDPTPQEEKPSPKRKKRAASQKVETDLSQMPWDEIAGDLVKSVEEESHAVQPDDQTETE